MQVCLISAGAVKKKPRKPHAHIGILSLLLLVTKGKVRGGTGLSLTHFLALLDQQVAAWFSRDRSQVFLKGSQSKLQGSKTA